MPFHDSRVSDVAISALGFGFTSPLALHLNERDTHGRLVCPLCQRPIRAGETTDDDGMYLRHGECRNRIVWAQWQGRTVKVLVRPRDWEDAQWRERFEADLFRTGWHLISVEAPVPDRPEYVYVLVPESSLPQSS
jgi:hypothetical protein